VGAKSTGELSSFGFNDRSVWSLVSANQMKNDFTFWSQSKFRTQRKTDPESEMTHFTMKTALLPCEHRLDVGAIAIMW